MVSMLTWINSSLSLSPPLSLSLLSIINHIFAYLSWIFQSVTYLMSMISVSLSLSFSCQCKCKSVYIFQFSFFPIMQTPFYFTTCLPPTFMSFLLGNYHLESHGPVWSWTQCKAGPSSRSILFFKKPRPVIYLKIFFPTLPVSIPPPIFPLSTMNFEKYFYSPLNISSD